MAPDRDSRSPSPIPTTEAENGEAEQSLVTDEQWDVMEELVKAVTEYRTEDGHDPSKVFHRKVNKRTVPDYYDIIKEPMAMSNIRTSIQKHLYHDFPQFVRDMTLISHNAQLYNRPEAGAYQDALVFKEVFEKELKKVLDSKKLSEEDAAIPDLGEIPPPSPRKAEEEVEDEDEDEEDEDEDEPDDSDDDGRPRRRRGPRSTAAITKREGGGAGALDRRMSEREQDLRRKRGRPPRVDTPMEARIKAVLKGLRKIKDANGEMKIRHFEKLPDKAVMPEYFEEIKIPMALDVLKKKSKRKKYSSVDHFMKDVEILFENAKSYNVEGSEIYKDAVILQQEARLLAEQEKKRPDTDYTMEDGRIPLPGGIMHNGELWKVGDWVHIQNPNDLAKPIVAQLYRTWQDTDGQKWVNACWYYRPEQTVHRFEKHFYEHEVVKTGQYRDHHIDEVVDRCFVMFFTRFNRGRPRGFPPDKEVYVCESRYNEEKHKLNKIKTWASCLPDEVREKDYEMDLFEHPRKMRKVPSPIAHLLPDSSKETDDLPKPTWGVANAPPIVGAVHRRPRESNESPPPEPTPPPAVQPVSQPARRTSTIPMDTPGRTGPDGDVIMGGTDHGVTPINGLAPQFARHPSHFNPSATPTPTLQHGFSHQTNASYASQLATPSFSHQTPHTQQYSSQSGYQNSRPGMPGYTYNPPRPAEVYHLNDAANLSIPQEVREQFHCDDHGRVLFFTSPPLDVLKPAKEGQILGHTEKYLEAKKKREDAIAQKRKQDAIAVDDETSARKRKLEQEQLDEQVFDLTKKSLNLLNLQITQGTDYIYSQVE